MKRRLKQKQEQNKRLMKPQKIPNRNEILGGANEDKRINIRSRYKNGAPIGNRTHPALLSQHHHGVETIQLICLNWQIMPIFSSYFAAAVRREFALNFATTTLLFLGCQKKYAQHFLWTKKSIQHRFQL